MDIRERFSFLGSSEDVISMVLGLLIVVVVAGLVVNYFQKKSGGSVSLPGVSDTVVPSTGASPAAVATTGEQGTKISGGEYLVMRGDSLWKIAGRKYGSGYNWVDIVKANKLRTTGLEVGQKLVLPDVPVRVVVRKVTDSIDGGEYVVRKGDSLSKIALRAYGDSFAWNKIYQANRQVIGRPDLIFVGTKLAIPR